MSMLPRLIRHKQAPGYLGIDRNKFDKEVRPGLTVVPMGPRAIAFDRLELDAWADAYIAACGRPGRNPEEGEEQCELGRKVSSPKVARGSSTSSTVEHGFFNDSEPSAKMKPKRGYASDRQNLTQSGRTAFDAAMIACGQALHGST